jgi:hypothetical protein
MMARHELWGFLVVLGFLAASGCEAMVVSRDREHLWNAAIRAAEQEGFRITDRDADRGYLFGVRRLMASNDVTEQQRLEMFVREARGGYGVLIAVRRPPIPVTFALTDAVESRGRLYQRDVGRVVSEYGSTAVRDETAERALRERLQAILAGAD